MEAGHARREVQPGDGQLGAGHRRADVRAGGPPHRREAGPHPQARPSPTRSPASRRPPCAARPAGGDPAMPRSPGCWTPGHGSRNAPGSTPRTSRSPPEPARSACTARAMRSAPSPWPGAAGNWSWHGWTCAARCARLGGRRKPADRARLLCAGRDLGAMSARRHLHQPARRLPWPKPWVGASLCLESRCGRRTTTTCSLPVPRFGSPLDARGARMSRWLRSIRLAACRAAAPGRCPRRHTQSCQVVGRARRRALGPGGRARPLAADASRPRSGGRR